MFASVYAQQCRIARRDRLENHKITTKSDVGNAFKNRSQAIRVLRMTDPGLVSNEDIVVAKQHSHTLTVVATIRLESADRLPPRSRNGEPEGRAARPWTTSSPKSLRKKCRRSACRIGEPDHAEPRCGENRRRRHFHARGAIQ